MGLSVLCGLVLGLVLNLAADWLPRRILQPQDNAPATPEGATVRPGGGSLARWAALLLLSIGLVLVLYGTAAGRSGGVSLPAGTVPKLAYGSLLLLIAAIDLEHRLVPNILIVAGLILAVGLDLLAPLLGGTESGYIAGGGVADLTTALLGAAVGGGLFLLLMLARRNALGAGDAKLALLIGMLTGFPWVVQALVVGILLGGLAAAFLLLFKVRGPKQYIPYAPYLVAGTMATLLYGQHITQWYLGLTRGGG